MTADVAFLVTETGEAHETISFFPLNASPCHKYPAAQTDVFRQSIMLSLGAMSEGVLHRA